ncbi:UvrD-helicase domain-containing protein [Mucilaginibacter ginsenosidivorax]|uniref:DNA 3'-5' helicase n=1 Tax=Mucilaginibacter ginsenosidivorax TaxID=862126 RepID=A0A5B8VTZ2_9SPHI|nr:UvrD-helicase domain-containing protein [Mucilaginibacter ginsenosidivorax]QEC74621.1 AAA family ATPase [Mucilaginibacter ginsenosidivorax]
MKKDKFHGIKPLTVILLCISIFGIWHLWKTWVRNKKAKDKLQTLLPEIAGALSDFDLLTNFENYFSNFREQQFLQIKSALAKSIPRFYNEVGLSTTETELITRFLTCYKNLAKERADYNDLFVKCESKKYAYLFDSLETYPLSTDQVEAIVRDEDNNLVIAGAGTGKTTTISAKVAYLLEKKLAKPQDLLIISFTKNAVNEMYDRCMKFCRDIPDADQLDIRTFNSFGYFVTRFCSSKEVLLAFDGKDDEAKSFLQERFSYLFKNDPDFQKKAVNFIAFFNRPERDEFSYESKDEYLKYEKSHKNVTLDGKQVNSKEEVQIGNFLCLFKIKYEYQKHYPLQLEDRNANFAAYRPDFYFPEYEIWHEHYGIDRDGNVPSWFAVKHPFKTGRETYHSGILWKEAIHEKYRTKLIKTYSYENKENTLLTNLKKRLEGLGVELKKRTNEELYELIQQSPDYGDFINLIHTFLGLLKSNGKQPGDIQIPKEDKRLKTFIDVFTPLFDEYERKLTHEHSVDFNDMINLATSHIAAGDYPRTYKYILVDEFQDMSLGRYELLKSLRKRHPEGKLYAVGDDWQSIFRFSGSDISIITEFAEHLGFTSQSAILTSYRFNDEILKTTSNFIQKNPGQIKKTLATTSKATNPSFLFHGLELSGRQLLEKQTIKHQCIRHILEGISAIQSEAVVFLIGRYRHNIPTKLQQLKDEFPKLNIAFFTAHSVKGLTADFSILLDVDSGVFGFPSEIADDPILNAVLHESDKFENAEERRLFYVATTRARHRNYLLYDMLNPSKFVTELIQLNSNTGLMSQTRCPECNGILVKRTGAYGEFYGCVHYPQCTGKIAVNAVI